MIQFLRHLFCWHKYFPIETSEPKALGKRMYSRQKVQCLKCEKQKYKYWRISA